MISARVKDTGVGGAHAVQHTPQEPAEAEREHDADDGADRAEPQSPAEKAAHDGGAGRAERHANPDFVRAAA